MWGGIGNISTSSSGSVGSGSVNDSSICDSGSGGGSSSSSGRIHRKRQTGSVLSCLETAF